MIHAPVASPALTCSMNNPDTSIWWCVWQEHKTIILMCSWVLIYFHRNCEPTVQYTTQVLKIFFSYASSTALKKNESNKTKHKTFKKGLMA